MYIKTQLQITSQSNNRKKKLIKIQSKSMDRYERAIEEQKANGVKDYIEDTIVDKKQEKRRGE